ncbi:hypothetical protein HGB25_00305 [Candidatus Saccharibacteria bacterium]|nr:hypothetical protein [Candidatus Saccharibacteria bacterium]
MAWLTGYTYRMSIPIANPSTQGDRAIDAVPFPAWFLNTSAGGFKIKDGVSASTNYAEVHVTTADGTTELPCALNTDRNAIYIDYANMPVGRTELFVYYGKASATAPASLGFFTTVRETAGMV